MKKKNVTDRIKTGVKNLDEILFGGLPIASLSLFAGAHGSGKTILSQQILFQNATPEKCGIFFQTLSEPTAKTLNYLTKFSYFKQEKLDNGSIHFIDLGDILRASKLEEAVDLLLSHIKRLRPAYVVIDSFKVFEDLAESREQLRKFSYEVALNLMTWETTALLLGEFNRDEISANPLFSIIDGIFKLGIREESGEQQRFIQVTKMRGTNHSRDDNAFLIDDDGVSIFAPKLTIRREPNSDQHIPLDGPVRIKVGIPKLDLLLGEGIPSGSSLLISGVAGTGKTLLSLEFIYRGAHDLGEKGIYISFEETEERLRTAAKSMGWDLEGEIEKGNVEIIFIPQTDVMIEKDLAVIGARIEKLGAKRVAIDSVSVFVHKIKTTQIAREKIFQLSTLVQKAQAVGFFVTDIPYGTNLISRFGVEETVVDGVIILSSVETNSNRVRYIEVYKLRNTSHLDSRYKMCIGKGGIEIDTSNLRQPKLNPSKGKKITTNRKKKK